MIIEGIKKKLFCYFLLFFLVININADTAKISSQRLVKSNVAQDESVSIIDEEVENMRKWGFGVNYFKDDGNPNNWVNYLVRLTLNNRIWYKSDIGAVYSTLLLSDHARKWVVYSYITKGDYYRGSSDLFNITYFAEVYEIIGFGNPNFGNN